MATKEADMNKDCPYCELNCPFVIKEQCSIRHAWHGVERAFYLALRITKSTVHCNYSQK